MTTTGERIRVLIWGKTYPELSRKYMETVCTGGLREDGRPIRLYPVPLRYIEGDKHYHLYDIIEVSVTKGTKDTRPESYKIDADTIQRVGHVDTDKHLWAARRQWIDRDTSWHYDNLDHLKADQLANKTSMGMIKPGEICGAVAVTKKPSARTEHEEKWEELTAQGDLFPKEYKDLEFLSTEIRLLWRCPELCGVCAKKPHNMMVLDWGLLELGRREGKWEDARSKLETISNLAAYDFRLFLGNFFTRPRQFGIIGLWYPKIGEQIEML